MSNELLVRDETTAAVTPMGMIQIAVQQGASLEQLEKLMGLQERYEANEARKAFVSAMSAFKLNPPEIFKNKHVKFGNTEYDHATLDNVSIAIGEALSKQGLSHRWNTSQADGKIKVTCVITHNMGHCEEVSLESTADTSGAKNSIQAIGSAVTYLQRYTLLAATGMAVQDQDDDGGKVEKMGLPEFQFQSFKQKIEAQLTKAKAKEEWQKAVKACEEVGDVESSTKLKAILIKHGEFIDGANPKDAA